MFGRYLSANRSGYKNLEVTVPGQHVPEACCDNTEGGVLHLVTFLVNLFPPHARSLGGSYSLGGLLEI